MDTLDKLRHGHMAGATRLDLSIGLTTFPREILELADTLEVLNLTGNKLSELPDDLHRLHKLKVLFCSDNDFTHLPDCIGRCPQLSMIGFKANRIEQVSAAALPAALRWLILTDNRISDMPPELGQRTQLQKLMLAGNRLTQLPDTLQHCHKLELLRISANQLTALPDWLMQMPNLTWLAYAGNPASATDEARTRAHAQAPSIAWSQLEVGAQLGEGASGLIHEARWHHDQIQEDVVVKLFKGSMTSDGLPQQEMDACLALPAHPHLIVPLGVVPDHPDGRQALVMRRLPPHYRNLAGPPSLASCTRDVYAAEQVFDVKTVIDIAQGVVSAGAHLHAHGIVHGDLYAHNTLYAHDGHTLLSDFGAASSLPLDRPDHAQALKAMEVRAFGLLLEELLARCAQPAEPPGILSRLHAMQARCTTNDMLMRPALAEVTEMLISLH